MLLTEFRLAFRKVEDLYQFHLRGSGVTARQFELLRILAITPDASMRQGDLSRAASMDRSTASDSLGRLVKSGCIRRRTAAEDQRVQVIALTTKGLQALAQGEALEEKAAASLTARLAGDAAAFREALQRIAEPDNF